MTYSLIAVTVGFFVSRKAGQRMEDGHLSSACGWAFVAIWFLVLASKQF